MTATLVAMRPHPDPLRVYADAISAGDDRLAELIAQRLFPWVRRRAEPDRAPAAAKRALAQVQRSLGL